MASTIELEKAERVLGFRAVRALGILFEKRIDALLRRPEVKRDLGDH